MDAKKIAFIIVFYITVVGALNWGFHACGYNLVEKLAGAVGGESAVGIARALVESGTMITYGAMSRQPLRVPNGLLIFKNITIRGFLVSRWYCTAEPQKISEMF